MPPERKRVPVPRSFPAPEGGPTRLWAPRGTRTGDLGWFTSSESRFGGPSCRPSRALSSRAAGGSRTSDTPVAHRLLRSSCPSASERYVGDAPRPPCPPYLVTGGRCVTTRSAFPRQGPFAATESPRRSTVRQGPWRALARLADPRATLSRHPGPSPDPAPHARPGPDHDVRFARHEASPEACSRAPLGPRPPAPMPLFGGRTRGLIRDQASPDDFCNETRRTGTSPGALRVLTWTRAATLFLHPRERGR